MCGEHTVILTDENGKQGSSPRVRGTQQRRQSRGRHRGIIPACAGNTDTTITPRRPKWDHPRVCGEHCRERRACSASWGIIPACAGNTRPANRKIVEVGDHPRVCGEHSLQACNAWLISGSSPRVRGTRRQQELHRHRRGIIPACAGNTKSQSTNGSSARDHPRVCGEHKRVKSDNGKLSGSSPRVRGTPAR